MNPDFSQIFFTTIAFCSDLSCFWAKTPSTNPGYYLQATPTAEVIWFVVASLIALLTRESL
jgi:hypothetical protein